MDKHKAGGNVLVTGATSSIRGREGFAAFAASKGGLRAICQSVAREFGPRVRMVILEIFCSRLLCLALEEHSCGPYYCRWTYRLAASQRLYWPRKGTEVFR